MFDTVVMGFAKENELSSFFAKMQGAVKPVVIASSGDFSKRLPFFSERLITFHTMVGD